MATVGPLPAERADEFRSVLMDGRLKGLILAAGEGTRLRPLTLHYPKPMVLIAGKPVIGHLVELLRVHGITDIAVNLHYRPEPLRNYLGDGSAHGVRITYSFEERLLGSAGAVKKLEEYFDNTFLVLYGDLLTNLDLSSLIQFHRAKRALMTVAVYSVTNPTECGLVDFEQDGRICRFVEKPPPEEVFTDLANTGIYVAEPGIMDYIPAGVLSDFGKDIFPRLLREGLPLYAYRISDYLVDIGTWANYHRAQQEYPKLASLPRVLSRGADPSPNLEGDRG